MAREQVRDGQPSMVGGLNTVSTDSALAPNQLRRAENARLTEFGAVIKRGGTQRITSAALNASGILNGTVWRKDDGSVHIIMVVVDTGPGGNLYDITATGSFPYTGITTSNPLLAATGVPTFAQFREGGGNTDYLYVADGGALNRWNGSTLTTNLSGTPNCTDITVHNQRLWGTGDSSTPQTIYYSALNDGDSLGVGVDGGGAIIIRTFGDEVVQTIASVGSSLLIWHRRGISRITGYGEADITADAAGLSADVGTIAKRSVVTVDNVAYFLSDRGLYVCSEAEVRAVASPAQPDPLVPLIPSLDATDLANIRATFNRATREYWISIPGKGIYVYNTVLQAWAGPFTGTYTTTTTKALVAGLTPDLVPCVYRGDSAGWVVQADPSGVYMDDVAAAGTGGTAVAMTVQFHRLYAGDPALWKAWRWGYLTAKLDGANLTTLRWRSEGQTASQALPPSTDQAWGTGTWGTGTWGGIGEQSYRVPVTASGYFVDVSVVDSSTSGLPSVAAFAAEGFAMGRR